jgi:OHCU decarboxylase
MHRKQIANDMMTFDELNRCSDERFVELLDGIYEHSPWVAARTVKTASPSPGRSFSSVTALKLALQRVVDQASMEEQIALVRSHPDLAADKVIEAGLSPASREEQRGAGLIDHGSLQIQTLAELTQHYRQTFDFPFVLAVKGPNGQGLSVDQIISTLQRRLRNRRDDELQENLRQIHRIAELRLNQRLGVVPRYGKQVLQWCEDLAAWSEESNALTCTYMTPSHRASAQALLEWMQASGMQAHIDAVGNVVGRYASDMPNAPALLTGSHYDTVRNGGKYDGRIGILVPVAVIAELHRQGVKLPYHLDVVGFAEEEGVRYKTAFLGSSALTGRFDPTWLTRLDHDGIALSKVLSDAGTDETAIAEAARTPESLIGYIEWHIEQGPVLLSRGLPVGVVTAIAGSRRYMVDLKGVASHAGTTPMTMRRDAAAAAAEITLLIESRCATAPSLVGTVGQFSVPNGSLNVVPGACRFSIDIRAGDDMIRDAAVDDVMAGIEAICERRGIRYTVESVLASPTTQCAPWLREHIAAATITAVGMGSEAFALPSGAGHDAVEISHLTDVAMLFVRCGNGGISHNPLETVTADDLDLSAHIFQDVLQRIATDKHWRERD